MNNKIKELEDDYSDAKDNYLAAAHNEELARIAACDARYYRYDITNADSDANTAYLASISASLHMFSVGRNLDRALKYDRDLDRALKYDNAIDNKED